MPDILSSLSDSITNFFKINLLGLPLWFLLAGVIFFLYFFVLKRKTTEDKYRNISLLKEVKNEMKIIFETSEENIGFGKTLCIGPTRIGYIYKMINYNWLKMPKGKKEIELEKKLEDLEAKKIDTNVKKEEQKYVLNSLENTEKVLSISLKKEEKSNKNEIENKVKEIKKEIENLTNNEKIIENNILNLIKFNTTQKSFYGFKVGKKGIANKVKDYLLQTGYKYYFVDRELVTFNPFEVVINPFSQYTNFIDVMVFSQTGKEIIEDIAYKKTMENILEEQVNFIPKMSFLETRLANMVAKYRELTKLEKEKYEGKIEKMTEED